MSYAVSLGTLDGWSQWVAHVMAPDEAYVYRVHVAGLPVSLRRVDALELVHAAGEAFHAMGFDQRAVALGPDGVVDVVMSVPETTTTFAQWPGVAERTRLAFEGTLRKSWPTASVSDDVLGRLTEPEDAIRFWLAQPLLYDHRLAGGQGAPTSSYAHPPDYAIVRGKADDGPRALPVVGPNGGPPKPPGNTLVWVAGAGALVLGWAYLRKPS